MAVLKTLGDWLEGSGWTSITIQANIASAGTANSLLKASHVTRTRHAHPVTACGLYILMHKAYEQYVQTLPDESQKLEFKEWQEQKSSSCPHFMYWELTLKLELLLLLYIRSFVNEILMPTTSPFDNYSLGFLPLIMLTTQDG